MVGLKIQFIISTMFATLPKKRHLVMWKDEISHCLLGTYHVPGSVLSNDTLGSSYSNL